MPLYEYVCQSCGAPFEKLTSFAQADQPQTCPKCGDTHSRRKLSSFAVSGNAQPAISARPASSPFT